MSTFDVRQTGRNELLYLEDDHQMSIYVEHGYHEDITHKITADDVGKGILIVYTSTISQWLPPFDHEPITEAKKATIARNDDVRDVSVLQARVGTRDDRGPHPVDGDDQRFAALVE